MDLCFTVRPVDPPLGVTATPSPWGGDPQSHLCQDLEIRDDRARIVAIVHPDEDGRVHISLAPWATAVPHPT